MTTIDRAIEIHVPVSTAYNQWTQFESFPRFMQDVQSVEQTDERHLHWKTRTSGVTEEWDAEITEQIPDKRIAWHTRAGASHSGVVTFHRLADDRCRVMLQLGYEPHGIVEQVGSAFGVVGRRIKRDLRNFKKMIEEKGTEEGAWRGTVPSPDDRRRP